MKKYELTEYTKILDGSRLFRIRALRTFGDVKKGDLGGYIEKEQNLSHEDKAWVYGYAEVSGNAIVNGNAIVRGNVIVRSSADYACIQGFGSKYRTTTFYCTKDGGCGVSCGSFCGTLDEFRAKVQKTHGDSKHAREYLMELHLAAGS